MLPKEINMCQLTLNIVHIIGLYIMLFYIEADSHYWVGELPQRKCQES